MQLVDMGGMSAMAYVEGNVPEPSLIGWIDGVGTSLMPQIT